MKRLFERRWQLRLFRRVAPWIAKVTLSCSDMSRLSSAAFERPLTLRERAQRLVHFLICDWCRRYAAQLRFLHRAARRLGHDCPHHSRHRLSDQARSRLKERLASESSGPRDPV